jgi:hypothetical protein
MGLGLIEVGGMTTLGEEYQPRIGQMGVEQPGAEGRDVVIGTHQHEGGEGEMGEVRQAVPARKLAGC